LITEIAADVEESDVLWEETIQSGASWSLILRRGDALRLVNIRGGANAAAIFYNFDCLVERYNMPDTLKAQHTAHLTKDHVIYSDMGRVLCSITHDTCGWHDPLGGFNDAGLVAAKYGRADYQEHRNEWHRNTRDNLLEEIMKYNLSLRDLGPTVNFFSKVRVDDTGRMTYVAGHSKPGEYVQLRSEMNVLVALDTGQHPLDPNPSYDPKPVQVSVRRVGPAGPGDACRFSCPENARAFINTERYFNFR
jgi:urea carboxylase-associated protein 2